MTIDSMNNIVIKKSLFRVELDVHMQLMQRGKSERCRKFMLQPALLRTKTTVCDVVLF